jgi:O-antigen/teichoic acid export membrane protein
MDRLENNSSRTSIQNLKVSLMAQAINLVTGVAKTFIFTIFISPGNFGLIALSSSITGIIQLLKDFGYSTYIIQQKEISQSELHVINTRIVLLGFVAFVLTCLVTYPITTFYRQPELYWIIPISGAQFIFNSFTIVPVSILRRKMEFDKVAKIEVGSNLGSLFCGLVLLIFIRSYWVLLYSGVSYLIFQILIIVKLKSWEFKLGNPLKLKISRSSTKFGAQVTTFNILTFISANLDNLIIGKLFGQNILGVYSKGFEFGVTNIDKVKRPVQNVYFSDIAQKDNTSRSHLFFQYLLFIIAILLIIVGPFLIYADVMIDKIFGSQWKQLNIMLPPFLLTSFLWITMSFADQFLIVNTNMKKYLVLGIAKSVIGSASIIVASFWGVKAIAWSYLIYHAIFFIPFCYYSFLSLGAQNNLIYRMLKETTMIVLTAMAAVTIPWLLVYNKILSPQISLLLFILCCYMLYAVIWNQVKFYEPLAFIKSLFKRDISNRKKTSEVISNLDLMESA